jgi:hypothetical protein
LHDAGGRVNVGTWQRGNCMRTALAFLVLVSISSAALAQIGSPAPPAAKAAVDATGAVSTPAAVRRVRKTRREKVAATTTEQAKTPPPDALTSCLQLWEPATHMTRREWAHACRRVDQRIKAATLQ